MHTQQVSESCAFLASTTTLLGVQPGQEFQDQDIRRAEGKVHNWPCWTMSEQSAQGEGFIVHGVGGQSLAPPTHAEDVSLPLHLTQTGQQQGKPSLAEVIQHKLPWAEKQVPHTLSYLALLCLFPLVPVPPIPSAKPMLKAFWWTVSYQATESSWRQGASPTAHSQRRAQSGSSYKYPLPTQVLLSRISMFYFSNTKHEQMSYSRTHHFPLP